MKKKLLLALASAAIIAGIAVIAVLGGNRNMEVHADDTHVHCECGGTVDADVLAQGSHVCDATKVWTPITTVSELTAIKDATYSAPTDVYAYLANNLTVTSCLSGFKANLKLHLCLNGHKITSNITSDADATTKDLTAKYIFGLNTSFKTDYLNALTICDCSAEQTGELTHTAAERPSSLQGGTILAGPGSTLIIYGGTISNGKATGKYTKVSDGSSVSAKNGGNITVEASGQTTVFKMFGGTIKDGEALEAAGGNVYTSGGTAFDMYGGTITGGKALNGGNAAPTYGSSKNSPFHLYGGVISDGVATGLGGNIGTGSNGANINIHGGLVTGGTVNSTTKANASITVSGSDITKYTNCITGIGGNIGIRGNGTLRVYGGTIQNGTINVSGEAQAVGGNIGAVAYRNSNTQQLPPTVNISGGIIKNGTINVDASQTMNAVMGCNIGIGNYGTNRDKLDNKGTLNITGGTITNDLDEGGTKNTTYGGFFTGSGTVYIRGGNLYIGGGVTANITGTDASPVEISNGYITSSKWCIGANIAQYGSTTVSGNVSILNANGNTSLDGGNLYLNGGNKFSMTGGIIANGYANTGGNMTAEGDIKEVKTFTGTTILGGTSNSNGGSISNKSTGTLIFTDCTIDGGHAGGNGGNIYTATANAKYKFTGCTIANGYATKNGGNVYAENTSTLDFIDTVLSSGAAHGDSTGNNNGGGNICGGSAGSTFNLTGCRVENGTSTYKAGNIMAYGIFNLEDTVVTGGSATSSGGNVFVQTKMFVEGGEFSYGTGSGAGNIFVNISDATESKGIFEATGTVIKNGSVSSSTGTGRNITVNGGIKDKTTGEAYYSGKCTLTDCEVILEDLTGEGGIDYTKSGGSGVNINVVGNLVLVDTKVIGGETTGATSVGGCIYLSKTIREKAYDYDQSTTLTISGSDSCVTGGISANANKGGANIFADENSIVEINDGVFSDAYSVGSGSSIYFDKADVTINGGTFIAGERDSSKDQSTRNLYFKNSKFTITGGNFLQNDIAGASNTNTIYIYSDCDVNSRITGGYIDRIYVYSRNSAGPFCKGTTDGAGAVYTPFISGGFYNTIGTLDYILDPYKRCNTSETITVGGKDYTFKYEVAEGYVVTTTSFSTDAEGTKTGSGIAAITGAGTFKKGTSTTLTAPDVNGFTFVGWATADSADATAFTLISGATELTYTAPAGTEDALYVAIYKVNEVLIAYSVTGEGVVVTIDGEEAAKTGEVKAGTKLTVSYDGTDFANYANESSKIVSTDAEYTTEVYTETILVLNVKAQDANATQLVFLNERLQVSCVINATAALTTLPDVPVRLNRTGGTWDKTLDELNAVIADPSVTYYEINLGGYTWTTEESTLYDDTNIKDAVEPAIEITTAISTKQTQQKNGVDVYTLSIVASRKVPEGFTMIEQGILFTTSAKVANATEAEAILVNGNATATKYRSASSETEDYTALNAKNAPADVVLYAKGYLVYLDSDNELHTIYTDLTELPATSR